MLGRCNRTDCELSEEHRPDDGPCWSWVNYRGRAGTMAPAVPDRPCPRFHSGEGPRLIHAPMSVGPWVAQDQFLCEHCTRTLSCRNAMPRTSTCPDFEAYPHAEA